MLPVAANCCLFLFAAAVTIVLVVVVAVALQWKAWLGWIDAGLGFVLIGFMHQLGRRVVTFICLQCML